jgi:two-component system, NtrC family, nitrogen regulation sensor histidine kinase GlnL
MLSHVSLNSLNTAILVLDNQCRVVSLNNSAAQMLGFSDRQFKGESLFNLIEADFNQDMLLQLSEQQQSTFIEEAHLKTHSGPIVCNVLLSCFEQEEAKFILLELQTSEHHSQIIKDLELQQQNRVSNHLIRNLAHEIKNPLGGIKGAAQLLQRKLSSIQLEPNPAQIKPAGAYDNYCQIIIQEADRLSELVNRLLLPAIPEEKSLVNVHQLIEKSLEIVLLQSELKINIIKDYDPSLPELFISPGQIQQSLLNLIKNAVEAVNSNEGLINLKTRVILRHTIGNRQFKQVIRIDIIDNGSGIPESIIKDIFFPTISGKNSSGLGLSIAQSLVQRHNGIIEVESSNQRTCFSLYLPLNYSELNKM